MYSGLFWDHNQLLSCRWALRRTFTFEGKGPTYSPLVFCVFFLFFRCYIQNPHTRTLNTEKKNNKNDARVLARDTSFSISYLLCCYQLTARYFKVISWWVNFLFVNIKTSKNSSSRSVLMRTTKKESQHSVSPFILELSGMMALHAAYPFFIPWQLTRRVRRVLLPPLFFFLQSGCYVSRFKGRKKAQKSTGCTFEKDATRALTQTDLPSEFIPRVEKVLIAVKIDVYAN